MVESNENTYNNRLRANVPYSDEYLSEKGRFVVLIGISENRELVTCDLGDIPHIFVGGYTGSGKTAFVRTILAFLLLKYSPEDLGVMIFDSKGIEYRPFAYMPHLLVPIIEDRYKLASALTDLVDESNRRMHLFGEAGCKDFAKYNAELSNNNGKLKEWFVILDDCTLVSIHDAEWQKLLYVLAHGRIAGIHVIVVSSALANKSLQLRLISNISCKIMFWVKN